VQRCAGSKSLPNRRKERENDRDHGLSKLSRRPSKFNSVNENRVFGRHISSRCGLLGEVVEIRLPKRAEVKPVVAPPVPVKKSVHIEIVAFMQSRPVTFSDHVHFAFLTARLFSEPAPFCKQRFLLFAISSWPCSVRAVARNSCGFRSHDCPTGSDASSAISLSTFLRSARAFPTLRESASNP
jgi:hypothetical protein